MSQEKTALQNWANRNGITAAKFARATGYSYQHAWNLLAGVTDPTPETLGRIVIAYGIKSAAPIANSFENKTRQPVSA